jgi:hypothetical protein
MDDYCLSFDSLDFRSAVAKCTERTCWHHASMHPKTIQQTD